MRSAITILGSTGSIGINTLDVIALHPDKYDVIALTANTSVEKLFEQCLQWQPSFAVMRDSSMAALLKERLRAAKSSTQVLSGYAGLAEVSRLPEVDMVMAAIVGAAGLPPALEAIRAGKRILIANKEVLVMAGELVVQEAKKYGAELLPIDSEHNALWQCFGGNRMPPSSVKKIILTASGGALRDVALTELPYVTPDQACKHPNWLMGRKITVDCATMINKGFEVIEAAWLFEMPLSQIEVVIHPQSMIHSLVEYIDGSFLAQLGSPDMRIPISYALAWPERIASGATSIDIQRLASLEFRPVDDERYPCLDLAYAALKQGGTATAILNAANEVAVEAFLSGLIPYTEIAVINSLCLEKLACHTATEFGLILEDDRRARDFAYQYLQEAGYTIDKKLLSSVSTPILLDSYYAS